MTTVTTAKEEAVNLETRKKLETEIEGLVGQGIKVWESIAKRLTIIHDEALWTVDHRSFRAYIKDRWGKTAQWAYQLMRSYSKLKAIQDRNPAAAPKTERAARQLKNPKAENLDSTGYKIPDEILEVWERREEINDQLSNLSAIKKHIEEAQRDEDPLYTGIVYSAVLADLSKLYTGLAEAKPYCVCTQCQGRFVEKCPFCKGKGFISKFKFQHQTPEEMRELRLKVGKNE